jgi:glutamate-1-semialdehyde 2,1-aminomutase
LVGLFLAGPEEAGKVSGQLTPPTDYVEARALAGNGLYAKFFHAMLLRGVALAPGPYEVMFPGLAHNDALLNQVVDAAGEAATEVAASSG